MSGNRAWWVNSEIGLYCSLLLRCAVEVAVCDVVLLGPGF